MIEAEFVVLRPEVYEEVHRTVSYEAAKNAQDSSAYDRISTTADNEEMFERFWEAAGSLATDVLKPFVTQLLQEEDESPLMWRRCACRARLTWRCERACKCR